MISTITTSLATTRQRSSGGTNCLELTASIMNTTRIKRSPRNSNISDDCNKVLEHLERYSVHVNYVKVMIFCSFILIPYRDK